MTAPGEVDTPSRVASLAGVETTAIDPMVCWQQQETANVIPSDRPILLTDTDIYRYRYRYRYIGIGIA